MSNDDSDTVVGEDLGPSYGRADSDTDDSDVTMDTAPRETAADDTEPAASNVYTCETCGRRFEGGNAQQRYASHFNAPDHASRADATDTSGPSTNLTGSLGAVQQTLVGMVADSSDAEPESGYTGPFSTRQEVIVGAIGATLGIAWGHQTVTLGFIVALAGLGFAGAEIATRSSRFSRDVRDILQANSASFIIGVGFGRAVIAWQHGNLPTDVTLDDVFHLFGRHAHSTTHSHAIDAALALL